MVANLSQIINEVKNIKIFSKRISAEVVAGPYQSAFRGAGLELRQIREYAYGDDVRSIAWSASAKIGRMMVKEFTGERDRAVLVVPCLGPSMDYSSVAETKASVAVKLSAMLAVLAEMSGDRFGYVLPLDKIAFSNPTKGMPNIVSYLSKLSGFGQQECNIKGALKLIAEARFWNHMVFLISDWLEPLDEETVRLLKIVSKKHELSVVRVLDATERHFPDVGLLSVASAVVDSSVIIDTSSSLVNEVLAKRLCDQDSVFRSTGAALLDITAGDCLDKKLAQYFRFGSIRNR